MGPEPAERGPDGKVLDARRNNGGRREGAGAKKRDAKFLKQWFKARGIEPVHAAEVLSRVANEINIWRRLLTSEDDHVVLETMKFLVMMRDGRPAQQINISSVNVHLSPEEVERARSIVRELMPSIPAAPVIEADVKMLEGQ